MTDAAPVTTTTRIQCMFCPVCRIDLMLADRQGVRSSVVRNVGVSG